MRAEFEVAEKTAASAPAAAGEPRVGRLVALDAYRGFTVLAMISGGLGLAQLSAAHRGQRALAWLAGQLEHAAWQGYTAWDLIQPCFLFIVGVSLAFSGAARRARGQSRREMLRHALFRAAALVALGIAVRLYDARALDWTLNDVLAQIGLGYIFLFLLWGRSRRLQVAVVGLILAGYWALFVFWPEPATAPLPWPQPFSGLAAHWNGGTNPAQRLDLWFLNLLPRATPFTGHSGGYATLNFVPSLATMILGLLAGEGLRGQEPAAAKGARLALWGVAGIGAGWVLGELGVCPLVKRLWTPSWALFGAGWAALFLAGFLVATEHLGLRRWALPGVAAGRNALLLYILHATLVSDLPTGLHRLLGSPPPSALLAVADDLLRLLVTLLVGTVLYRCRIFVRL